MYPNMNINSNVNMEEKVSRTVILKYVHLLEYLDTFMNRLHKMSALRSIILRRDPTNTLKKAAKAFEQIHPFLTIHIKERPSSDAMYKQVYKRYLHEFHRGKKNVPHGRLLNMTFGFTPSVVGYYNRVEAVGNSWKSTRSDVEYEPIRISFWAHGTRLYPYEFQLGDMGSVSGFGDARGLLNSSSGAWTLPPLHSMYNVKPYQYNYRGHHTSLLHSEDVFSRAVEIFRKGGISWYTKKYSNIQYSNNYNIHFNALRAARDNIRIREEKKRHSPYFKYINMVRTYNN